MQCDREGCSKPAQFVCADCYQGIWCSAECKKLDATDHEEYDCFHPQDLDDECIMEELGLIDGPSGSINETISVSDYSSEQLQQMLTRAIAEELSPVGDLADRRRRRTRRRDRRRKRLRRQRALGKQRRERRALRRDRRAEERETRRETGLTRREDTEARRTETERERYEQAVRKADEADSSGVIDMTAQVGSLFYLFS